MMCLKNKNLLISNVLIAVIFASIFLMNISSARAANCVSVPTSSPYYQAFTSLMITESSCGKSNICNGVAACGYAGCCGILQLNAANRAACGFPADSEDAYLADINAQFKCAEKLASRETQTLASGRCGQISSQLNGAKVSCNGSNTFTANNTGLLAAAWLGGGGGACGCIESCSKDSTGTFKCDGGSCGSSDSNGTSICKYMRVHSGAGDTNFTGGGGTIDTNSPTGSTLCFPDVAAALDAKGREGITSQMNVAVQYSQTSDPEAFKKRYAEYQKTIRGIDLMQDDYGKPIDVPSPQRLPKTLEDTCFDISIPGGIQQAINSVNAIISLINGKPPEDYFQNTDRLLREFGTQLETAVSNVACAAVKQVANEAMGRVVGPVNGITTSFNQVANANIQGIFNQTELRSVFQGGYPPTIGRIDLINGGQGGRTQGFNPNSGSNRQRALDVYERYGGTPGFNPNPRVTNEQSRDLQEAARRRGDAALERNPIDLYR